ncbi:hypothetical protein ADILRU_2323 [Leifsonia rubra CMS 76R]|nr:hypothetical protein ADILRU_2323 [Leifsonia rubra CMS 76R]
MTTTRRPWFLTLAAVATLSGCSLSHEPVDPAIEGMMRDDALASSTPGFLSDPQVETDLLPEEAAGLVGGDPTNSRFQGMWNGQQVYLTVKGDYMVSVVTGPWGDEQVWSGGGGLGNTASSHEDTANGEVLIYLPQGTETVPDGWIALSDWVSVKQTG